MGFFFVGQLLIPFVLSLSGLSFATTGSRGRALYSMLFYLLMSASGIAVLAGSIWTYRPIPSGWFRLKLFDRWPLWGVGGYVVAAAPDYFDISLKSTNLERSGGQ